jgi:MerR family copper efflux transcriptional regulator
VGDVIALGAYAADRRALPWMRCLVGVSIVVAASRLPAKNHLTFESGRSRTVGSMSNTYQIADAARRSGFAASTLRYYEEIGLLRPAGRTAGGYRAYDDADLDRLAFIGRAKQLGCTLDEIAELLVAWEGQRCEPVQNRLRQLVDSKLDDAERRSAELTAFTAQLQQAAATLGIHTPSGACDADCGCLAPAAAPVMVTLGRAATSEVPIACTLSAADTEQRLAEWKDVLSHVRARRIISSGLRLEFDATAPVGAIATLAAAEQECCAFFDFTLRVDRDGIALEVGAPADAAPMLHDVFGGMG